MNANPTKIIKAILRAEQWAKRWPADSAYWIGVIETLKAKLK